MNDVNKLFEQACNALSWLGQVLIDDDAHDFGWFTYQDRKGHKDHPSPFHHWQVGVAMVAIGEGLKAMITFLDALGVRVDLFFNQIRGFLSNLMQTRFPFTNPQTKQIDYKNIETMLGEAYSRRRK